MCEVWKDVPNYIGLYEVSKRECIYRIIMNKRRVML